MARDIENDSVEDKEPEEVMGQEEKLARLEMFVEKLITNYSELKKEHVDLQSRFLELQKENKENQELITGLQHDRKVMYDRVTGLIDRIEEWEGSLDTGREAGVYAGQGHTKDEGMAPAEQTFTMGVE